MKDFFLQWYGKVTFGPIVNRLSSDQDVGGTIRITYVKDFRELPERKTHSSRYRHLAIASATWLKFVMRHFAPAPTSEARFCKAAAELELTRARRTAAMRLCASSLLTSLCEITFTRQYLTQIS